LIHLFDNLLYQPAPAAFAGVQNSRGLSRRRLVAMLVRATLRSHHLDTIAISQRGTPVVTLSERSFI